MNPLLVTLWLMAMFNTRCAILQNSSRWTLNPSSFILLPYIVTHQHPVLFHLVLYYYFFFTFVKCHFFLNAFCVNDCDSYLYWNVVNDHEEKKWNFISSRTSRRPWTIMCECFFEISTLFNSSAWRRRKSQPDAMMDFYTAKGGKQKHIYIFFFLFCRCWLNGCNEMIKTIFSK